MSVRGTFFDAYSRLRGHRVAAYRAEYEKALLSESGETIRRNRLRLVLDRARQDIPYYRDLAVGPQRDVFDELQRYPILTKDIIRPNRERLRAPDIENRHWYTNTSGGSTGEPIQLIQDREYADRSAALNAVLYGRMGYRFGQRQYRIWGSERDILQGRSATTRFWNFVYNSEILNAFRMSPETMREYLRILDRNPPRLLVCYAQAAYELARFALEHEIAIAAPQAMTCSAGTLYPFMRETIERAFGCPVYNWYGSPRSFPENRCFGFRRWRSTSRSSMRLACPCPPGSKARFSSRVCRISPCRSFATASATAARWLRPTTVSNV